MAGGTVQAADAEHEAGELQGGRVGLGSSGRRLRRVQEHPGGHEETEELHISQMHPDPSIRRVNHSPTHASDVRQQVQGGELHPGLAYVVWQMTDGSFRCCLTASRILSTG